MYQRTEGISPKVSVPTVVLGGLAVLVLLLASVLGGEGLVPAGLALLGASFLVAGLGYYADP